MPVFMRFCATTKSALNMAMQQPQMYPPLTLTNAGILIQLQNPDPRIDEAGKGRRRKTIRANMTTEIWIPGSKGKA